jgi:hypothetical protein
MKAWNKGKKGVYSPATLEKMRQAKLGKGFGGAKKGEHRSPHSEFKKGVHYSPKTEFKKGEMSESKNPMWKGDGVGYFALHDWVERNLGKPEYCAFCQKTEGKFQWANVSRAYKRLLSDWIRLCPGCHKLFDLGKITI